MALKLGLCVALLAAVRLALLITLPSVSFVALAQGRVRHSASQSTSSAALQEETPSPAAATQGRGSVLPGLLALGAGAAALLLSRRPQSLAQGNLLQAGRSQRVQCRGLQTGIVGLPNVGKSTLFNALTNSAKAEAANFPFCTIDPNIGRALVPDTRLDQLSKMASSVKTTPESIEYVDIAGLVRGASKGEGLGNKFLSNIRNVDAIVHVVRCFDDPDITHVDGSVNPQRDMETINLELIFSDIDQVDKRMNKLQKDIRNNVKGAAEERDVLERLQKELEAGKPVRSVPLTEKEEALIKGLQFLTSKPMLYATNVAEGDLATGNKWVEEVRAAAAATNDRVVVVSAAVEAELNSLEAEERTEYLESLGVKESGCESLIQETYKMLGLRTYYTCGETETRAWTIRAGWKAPQAAGVIHTDFEKGFIKAATIGWKELLECGSEEAAQAKGKLRIEGKEYEVQEGDVMHFRFSS